jgi:hypothetical protein
MSRFWAGAESSDSDSSSDDDSSYSSDGDAKGAGGNNRWVEFSDSDESDDEVRVVKSGKERALDGFNKRIGLIRAAMKARDYYAIQTEFDELAKAMIKAKKVLAEGVPRPLVRILVDLEDTYIPERLADKAAFKKLSARQGRALNRMKLTLKKHNKVFSVVMEHYRKNPDEGDADEDGDGNDSDSSDSNNSSSSSSSSDSDADADAKQKKPKAKAEKTSSVRPQHFLFCTLHHKDAHRPVRGSNSSFRMPCSTCPPTFVAVKAARGTRRIMYETNQLFLSDARTHRQEICSMIISPHTH